MAKVAVMTDSNSGITQKEGRELGITVLPMPFYINDELFFEDIDLSQEQFYERLESDAEVHTSQPSPASLMDQWDELLKEYDEIVYIPMSSGLSSSCENAISLSADYDGKVQVVDNHRISVTLRSAIQDAVRMVEAGLSAAQIKEVLEKEAYESTIYIMVDTLKYLKKGGRITPAAAMIGSVLNLKPVLQIQGDKLDAFAKARSVKNAKKIMLQAIKDDLAKRFPEAYAAGEMNFAIAFTHGDEEAIEEWKKEVMEEFGLEELQSDYLSLSVSCHIGPGALAIVVSKKAKF